jgi:SET domain-containing protein
MATRLIRRRSAIHGNGVFAALPIPRGEVVAEYKGRRITPDAADGSDGNDIESGHTFLFTLNETWDVDASVGGNIARWINHGCAPNCIAFVQEHPSRDPKKDRLFIEARRPIEPGEEILYDYGIVLDVPYTRRLLKIWTCRCGSKKCTGTMLKPKKPRWRGI